MGGEASREGADELSETENVGGGQVGNMLVSTNVFVQKLCARKIVPNSMWAYQDVGRI